MGPSASTVVESGAVTAGGVLSATVTVCVVLVPTSPLESAAVQVITTVLRPCTILGEKSGTMSPSTRSWAVPAPIFALVRVVVGPSASTVVESGAVTLGGVLSVMVRICVASAVLRSSAG